MLLAELVNLEFKGFFQRDPVLVELSRLHREKLKREHSDLLAQYDETHGSSDTQDAKINRRYDFILQILFYNPDSGLFLAKAKDTFGGSGLVGIIKDPEISFMKIYVPDVNTPDYNRWIENPLPALFANPAPIIDYRGRMLITGSDIFCNGTYQPRDISENFKGVWEMEASLAPKPKLF